VANGVWVQIAIAFSNISTIIPAFILNLTSSLFVIGIISSVESVGWFLPQFYVASRIQHLPKKKWLYDRMNFFRFACYLLMGVLVFLSLHLNTAILLIFFTLLYILYSFGGGIAAIPFLSIIGETIPSNRRGSLWSYRMFLGGSLAALAALTVNPILNHFLFPYNYGILFSLTAIILLVSFLSFSLVYEPTTKQKEEPQPFQVMLSESRRQLRQDPDYRKIMFLRLAFAFWGLALPFYVVFALQDIGMPEANIGFLFSVQTVGLLLTNLAWGYLSDHFGNRLVIILNSFTAMLIPVLAIASAWLGYWGLMLIYAAFFIKGSLDGGFWIGYSNYLVDIAPKDRLPATLGFMNTFTGLTFFLTPLGGLLADFVGFLPVFALAAVSAVAMLVISVRLSEPRNNLDRKEVQPI
jgi:MFS family permease